MSASSWQDSTLDTPKSQVVQVYAPSEVAADSEKDELYDQLQGVIDEIPSFDIKLVMGDLNAKVSGDRRGIYHPA